MQPMEMGAPGQALMAAEQGPMASAMMKLQPLASNRIQQKRKLLEAVTCLEQQNMYMIYAGESTEQQLFWVQENSSFLQRNCLPNDCAPWNLSFHDLPLGQQVPEGETGKFHPEFLRIERPCSCTICCYNRPEAVITEVPSGRVIGSLRDPWACCDFTFEVKDGSGNQTLKSFTTCCQKGTFCPCPGNEVNFPVTDVSDGHEVALVKKIWMMGDCCPCCSKDWSNMTVRYGEVKSLDYKLLLMALASFIQIRQYDSRNNDG